MDQHGDKSRGGVPDICFSDSVNGMLSVQMCSSGDAKKEKERLRKERQRQRKIVEARSQLEAALHSITLSVR